MNGWLLCYHSFTSFLNIFTDHNQPVATTRARGDRSIVLRMKLKPGPYVIVPTTFWAHKEAEFLLRIYSESTFQAHCLSCQNLEDKRKKFTLTIYLWKIMTPKITCTFLDTFSYKHVTSDLTNLKRISLFELLCI